MVWWTPWCHGVSCATPRASCCAIWLAGNRRRLPTESAVLRGCLPLSLRTTRESHQMEPRTDRGAPARAGPSRAALPLRARRGDERQGVHLRLRGGGIAREHTDYLGTDLADIAREKAGIAKSGVPFVTGERDPAVRQELAAEAGRRGAAPVILVDITRPPTRRLGLVGRHQQANAWVALEALNRLPPPFGPAGDTWPESFGRAYVPGRFDVRGKWIFDVAHNPDGALVLAETLRDCNPPRPRHALVGVLGDKDYLGMIDALAPQVDAFVFTVPDTAPERRRWDLGRLERELGGLAVARAFEPSFAGALERVGVGAATVVVTGSFHTVGDALARLPGFAPVA